MIVTLVLSALAMPTAALAIPPAAVVQDAELKEKFKEFGKILSSKEDEDSAIALMDTVFVVRYKAADNRQQNLTEELEYAEPPRQKELKAEIKALNKELDAIAETVHSAFTHKRRKEVTQANLKLWKVGVFCLGQMGMRGAGYLWEVFEDKKRFRKEPDFRGLCLAEIGNTGAIPYVETLVDLLDHSEYLFIARAAEGLSRFSDVPGDKRKLAASRCVKLLAEYYEQHASDPSDVEAQEKYRKTGPMMIRALEELTGTTQKDPLAWRTWFNKNKNNADLWAD